MLLSALLSDPAENILAITNPGNGVTLAYSVPMLSRIDITEKYTQALCVTSSYATALQTATFIGKLAVYKDVRIGLAVKCEKGICLLIKSVF